MFMSLCGSIKTFDYPTLAECEKARDAVSKKAIGDGYAICAPTNLGVKK
jgi:hypothetical protein